MRKGHHVENDVLRQAPLFSALDDEAASALRSSMSENRLRRGEYEAIFRRHFPQVEITTISALADEFAQAKPRIRSEFLTGDDSYDATAIIRIEASLA